MRRANTVLNKTSFKTVNGTSSDETLFGTTSADTIYGLDGRDTIYGEVGNDLLLGGAGNDLLSGNGGNDTLNGGDGYDRVGYYYENGTVRVDLAAGTAIDINGGVDTLIDIEGVIGSYLNDYLSGNDQDNTIIGLEGPDKMDGRDGIDWLYYPDAYNGGELGIIVNLSKGFAIDGWGDRDSIKNFENVETASANDSVVGDAGDNYFWLAAGDDTAKGLGGDDSLYGKDGNDTLSGGRGDDYIRPGNGTDTVDGGAGQDEVSYADAVGTTGVTVDLSLGFAIGEDGLRDELIGIEAAQGSMNNDTLIGNSEDNLFGGLAGDDTLHGGDGTDRLSYYPDEYYGATQGVKINLSSGKAIDGWGNTDTFTGFEEVTGSTFNDTISGDVQGNLLFGHDGDDLIAGGRGDDTINGGEGNDTLDGGQGNDWFSYRGNDRGVVVKMGAGIATDRGGQRDVFTGFENVGGSEYKDKLIGDGGDNIFSGNSGRDIIKGGKGNDTVTYQYDGEDGVKVNLQKRFGIDGFGDRDKLIKIENAIGTDENDRLIGSKRANQLEGGAGNDVLNGSKGNDTLVGGEGDDLLIGGAGADTFKFSGDFGQDRIRGFAAADILEFEDAGLTAAEFMSTYASVDGSDCVIDIDGQQVTLLGVTDLSLVEDTLIFI